MVVIVFILLGDLETELQRVLMERSEVHDMLAKMETQIANLEEEKKKLFEEFKIVNAVYSLVLPIYVFNFF